MSGQSGYDPGLQAERTALAWTRTSFAVLANGALLMLRDFGHHPSGLGLVAACVAIGLAFATYSIGVRRQRTLIRRPLPQRITPRRQVYMLGVFVFVLIVVSVASLPF